MAVAVERRPIPQGGLTLAVLRDYGDGEIDAELRHFRIHRPANLSRQAKINLIRNYYAPDHSEATMQRAQEDLEMLRRGSIDAVIQDMAAITGMGVDKYKRLICME